MSSGYIIDQDGKFTFVVDGEFSSIRMADDAVIGFTGGGRIKFDSTPAVDEINILDANVGIGTQTPQGLVELSADGLIRMILRDTGEDTGYDAFIGFYTGTGAPASSNIVGGLQGVITQAHPAILKGEFKTFVNVGDSSKEIFTITPDGVEIHGIDTDVELAKLGVGASGQLVISTVDGRDTFRFIDLRSANGDYGIVIRESDGTGIDAWANLFITEGTPNYLNIVIGATQATKGLVVADGEIIGIGTATFGANQVGGMAMALGTEPTTDIENQFALSAFDFAIGNTCPRLRTENGTLVGLNQGLLTTDKPTFAGAILTDDLTLPKTSGKGIKVDTGTPTFGWRDLLGEISIKTAGANDPDYNDYASTGIYRYQFKNTAMTQIFDDFHIPHDYVPGTEVYIHVHWSQTTIDTGGAESAPGAAKWYFDANYSKGHDRGAFPASVVTVFAAQTASGTIRKHMIAEVQLSTSGQIGGQDLEPDGVATVRTYRDAPDEADTLDQRPWVHHVDLHYMSTNMATKDKAPDFYV